MTRAELEALSDRERAAICATAVMGWKLAWESIPAPLKPFKVWRDSQGEYQGPEDGLDFTSHEACARVRKRIAELGKQDAFIRLLLGNGFDGEYLWELVKISHLWGLVNAPPRAQIIAGILAVEEK